MKVMAPVLKRILECTHIDAYSKEGLISLQGLDEDRQKIFCKLVKHPEKGWQIEIVFLGNCKLMKQYRYQKKPEGWVTWGEMVFDLKQARELANFLQEAISFARLKESFGK